MDLNLLDLEGHVLSPGDIFWMKNSGSETLIARKADYLNYTLIEKLAKSSHKLVIENQINLNFQHEFSEVMMAHQSEIFFKEKLHWKKRIFELLAQNNLTQFEVGQLAWKSWSELDREDVKTFIDFDIDLFKRNLNIVSSQVFCALALGYYDHHFLCNLFTSSLKQLMSMKKIELLDRMKEELEIIRSHEILTDDDKSFIGRLYPEQLSWAGERYNGSGVNSYNKKEMNDLEIILVALERHFSYRDVDKENIFTSIKLRKFFCEERTLAVIRGCLTEERSAEMSA